MDILLELAKAFLQIGVFSFGGGYAIVALIRYVVVQQYAWLTDLEFLDVLAVSQITPGPIAINTATFVGYLMGGIWGSIVATFSSIAVPFLLVYSMSSLLNKVNPVYLDMFFDNITPLTFGLVIAATLSILKSSVTNYYGVGIFLFALLLKQRTKLNSALILLISGLLGEVVYLLVVH
ncbi:MAG TPA: chromate transporter [Coprothermobacter proteolyticus]|uniref:chromate transporter n=1 Tax=Coprothermobacter proteolyticus TaxID=35786 RepID=UPI000D2F96E8|nr:chromate transporter [Coprothermobacter proteolyticus]MBK6586225.1 chromate transporter [Coprothermobacter sp.]HOA65342.1 chromate transporter [Coprothermobacter proteolyticus]HOP45845.1 chromate transporter [Coprothermobacter proteolyticus]HPO83731.1 chromate transporter [Coprothermobacter proteolyticus]HPU70271.1 chromate transporter [Coprothermobacter proteolyticus]